MATCLPICSRDSMETMHNYHTGAITDTSLILWKVGEKGVGTMGSERHGMFTFITVFLPKPIKSILGLFFLIEMRPEASKLRQPLRFPLAADTAPCRAPHQSSRLCVSCRTGDRRQLQHACFLWIVIWATSSSFSSWLFVYGLIIHRLFFIPSD